jgi:RNA polymerase sigma factor (sigma-70 family)
MLKDKEEGGSAVTDRSRCINYALEEYEMLRRRLQKHVRNSADVKDFLQQLFVQLLAADLSSEGSIGSVSAFVWTVAKNLARDWAYEEVRRTAAHAILGVLEDPFSYGRLDNALQVRQEFAALHRAYRSLPRRLRRVLLLRKVGGFSQREIAARLKISESTVESYVRDAMDQLERKLMTKLDPVERQSVFTWLGRRKPND